MKSSNKKQKKFIAVIEDDQVENINTIANKLKDEGVKVDQVLSLSGIITGSANDLNKLNNLTGIKSVEEDKEKQAW